MKDSYLRSKEVQRVHALAISACTYRGVVAFPPGARLAPRVHGIYIQLCPGDTVEARPGCSFRDMLWSPEKHDRLPVPGFLRSVNLRGVNRSLRNPRKGFVRWVHESDEVAPTTQPCVFVDFSGPVLQLLTKLNECESAFLLGFQLLSIPTKFKNRLIQSMVCAPLFSLSCSPLFFFLRIQLDSPTVRIPICGNHSISL